MAPREAKGEDALVEKRFVHVFEEDEAGREVYRADSDAIPKSRRPRDSIVLHADGSATISRGGPDDRRVGMAARWAREKGVIVLRVPVGPGRRVSKRRVLEASAERLVLAR